MKTSARNFSILVAAALLFSGALVAYSFTEPPLPYDQTSVTAPLNISNYAQKKAGGLVLNAGILDPGGSAGASVGLAVPEGFVGIGFGALADPAAALDLVGNFFISGAIKPADPSTVSSGSNDQVLTVASSGGSMQWENRYTWLSLTKGAKKSDSCGIDADGDGNLADLGSPYNETCSTCPDASCQGGLLCWLGNCVPPPGTGTQQCGDGTCNVGESCSSCSSDCGQCAGTCGDTVFNSSQEECDPTGANPQTQCQDVTFLCGHDPNQNVPAQNAPTVCGNCRCVLNPILGCDEDPPPPPPAPCAPSSDWDGVSVPVCGGTCPPDEVCTASAGLGCFCAPGAAQNTNEVESLREIQNSIARGLEASPSSPSQPVQKEYSEYLSRWTGVRIVESAGHCSSVPNPPPYPSLCPGGWFEYEQPVCAELTDHSLLFIRNCYKAK